MNNLDYVKAYMASQKCPRNISYWNHFREKLKEDEVDKSLISQLDASGYITEWLKQKPTE